MDNLLQIMNVLGKSLDEDISIRQIAILTKIAYTSTYRTIKENKELFSIKKKGQAKFISINKENNIVKQYLIIGEREANKKLNEEQSIFKNLKHDIKEGKYSLILFGSRAENKHREKSDIDLCIINKKGEKNVSFTRFEILTGKEVNPMYFSEKEFIEMIKSKEHNVGKEILKKHLVLYGEEYYWNLVWKNAL